ncbi:GrpB family protein [Paenibacillus planticolens]|uniref:GrpB family protein n=1 Tax=Paenibacillus planticolens TaxID=2654976 RepID=A0ABX1ZTE7_9BACL|nr:GrpB family protein [Paenibacillus planticolens]NOV02119.1 GrpB family protein [Paenibacillus planticolens]
MPEPIIVVAYREEWKEEFASIAQKIRGALGEIALRIDHIGSTSIQGLDAKPIIDIQVSLESLEPIEKYKDSFEEIGYYHKAENRDKTKRYFREKPGSQRTHIHVREHGSWSSLFPLLFRDYLRCHQEECQRYVEFKYECMAMYRNERERYVEAKEPLIWEIMRSASRWSQETGWKPGASDY